MTVLLEWNEQRYLQICHKLCPVQEEKAHMQMFPLQMMDIPDQPFDKIAIDLITDLNVSLSGNQHIITISDLLIGWPEAFPIPNKNADTIVHVFINNYLLVHIHLRYILSNNGMEFKNQLMDDVLQHLASIIFSPPHTIHRGMENWRFSASI